ncbi:NAD(P)-binding protein [Annulohypoxylon truncatum]|uniref:NAD(P)-binding protein n=1 Tax=Annulohypoxylon truncatum TaxID=327061 RepID=UPI0020087C15|nr:NAD(P)-binding protein [Annulohypoxylon truncatum]KAI1204771.1 NAD(P)-binding protein [Annulohypoxylon truncatum]
MMTSRKGTIIVTGANGHLGSAIARHIVSSPELQAYHSIFIVRDGSATNSRLTSALKAGGEKASYEVVSLDLASLTNVRQVATTINGRVTAGTIPQIRGLVLNAAFIEFETQTWAEEGGFDMAFVANYLGHWLLTVMLLQSIDPETGRITIVGSDAHNPDDWLTTTLGTYKHPDDKWRPFISGENIDQIAFGTWSTRADDPSTRNGMRRYGAAKFCLVTMISELQRRLNSDPLLHRITTVGVDPGSMASPEGIARRTNWFGRSIVHGIIMPIMGYVMMWLYPESNGKMRTTERSARDVMRAAMDVSVAKAAYFDGTAPAERASEAQDVRKREIIWRDSVRYTQLREGETVLKDWK